MLHLARQNPDGSPDYHGWPDRFGFLPSNQAVFNPVGGPLDDLCSPDPTNPPSMCTASSHARILAEDVPVRDVLAFPPQPIIAPLAIEAADSSITGLDFVPESFVRGPVQPGGALYSLEGDLGMSAANATAPAPEVGHEVKLINFTGGPGQQLALICSASPTTRPSSRPSRVGSPGSTARPTSGSVRTAALISPITRRYAIQDNRIRI
jgi:hypothetical protein